MRSPHTMPRGRAHSETPFVTQAECPWRAAVSSRPQEGVPLRRLLHDQPQVLRSGQRRLKRCWQG